MPKVTAPSNLTTKARKLWRAVTEAFDLRADELRLLEDACREIDLIDALAASLAASEMMVLGSQGQPVVNPLVAEIRQHRMALKTLLVALKLPDEASEARAQADRSVIGRKAAEARWRRTA